MKDDVEEDAAGERLKRVDGPGAKQGYERSAKEEADERCDDDGSERGGGEALRATYKDPVHRGAHRKTMQDYRPPDPVVVMMMVVVMAMRVVRYGLEPEGNAIRCGVQEQPKECETKRQRMRAKVLTFSEALPGVRQHHARSGEGPGHPRPDDFRNLGQNVKADQVDDRRRDHPLKTSVQRWVATQRDVHDGTRGERCDAQGQKDERVFHGAGGNPSAPRAAATTHALSPLVLSRFGPRTG